MHYYKAERLYSLSFVTLKDFGHMTYTYNPSEITSSGPHSKDISDIFQNQDIFVKLIFSSSLNISNAELALLLLNSIVTVINRFHFIFVSIPALKLTLFSHVFQVNYLSRTWIMRLWTNTSLLSRQQTANKQQKRQSTSMLSTQMIHRILTDHCSQPISMKTGANKKIYVLQSFARRRWQTHLPVSIFRKQR